MEDRASAEANPGRAITVVVAGGLRTTREGTADDMVENHVEALVAEDLADAAHLGSAFGRPFVTLLLSGGPIADELDIHRRLRSRHRSPRAIVRVGTFRSVHEFTVYRGAGVRGLVDRQSPSATIIEAVLAVSAGEVFEDPEVPSKPIDRYGLSGRQLDVLGALKLRCTNGEIADLLSISTNTVKWHLKGIYEKMGVNSRVEARDVAFRAGILGIPWRQAPPSGRSPG